MTMKLLTNVNFVNFFKKMLLAKLLVLQHGGEVLCNTSFIQIFSRKVTKQDQNCKF